MHFKCLILALVGFIRMQNFLGKVFAALSVRSKSAVPILQVVVLAAMKPVSEVLNVVDQDELLLGASVHKVPEDDVPASIHPHVAECVRRETRLNQTGRQLPLLLQN